MKKIYIFIFFLSIGKSFGQVLQNANWYFANGTGITFNTTPPSALQELPPSVDFEAEEGSAIISDNDGNVLFFTEGQNVWLRMPDGSNQVIASGLYGDESSAQNAVIVHKPGSSTNYYIFTIKGATSDNINRGVYYSEIEIEYPEADVVFQNQPLNDDLGNPINGSWGNIAEAITAVTHADSYQYWVEVFVGTEDGDGKILSYLVTDEGVIGNNPESSEVFTPESYSSALKIKDSHIAVATSDNGLYLGSFDSATGEVEINQSNPVGNYDGTVYTAEFSPSGNNLFFGSYTASYLMAVEVNNPTVLKTFTSISLPRRLQIGIDNKIYLTTGSSLNHLSVLSTPDNILNPGFVLNTLFVGSFSALLEYGLPQLVPIQPWNGSCINIRKVLVDVVAPEIDEQQASNMLLASNTIYSGAKAIYHAGNTVVLSVGFHGENGSTFRGYIEWCSGEYVGREAYNQAETKKELGHSQIEKITIHPNPSVSSSEIAASYSRITHISIFSIEGKRINTVKVENNQSYQLDTADLLKGIYIVMIETADGEIHSEKLFKS